MYKNYPHSVIRLRKGKPGESQVYWLIVILNIKKASSHKIIERIGFYRQGPSGMFSIDSKRLSYHLNRGAELKKSVKQLIKWSAKGTRFYCVYKKKRIIQKILKKLNLKLDKKVIMTLVKYHWNKFRKLYSKKKPKKVRKVQKIISLEKLLKKCWIE